MTRKEQLSSFRYIDSQKEEFLASAEDFPNVQNLKSKIVFARNKESCTCALLAAATSNAQCGNDSIGYYEIDIERRL